jgi:hypothetical protein
VVLQAQQLRLGRLLREAGEQLRRHRHADQNLFGLRDPSSAWPARDRATAKTALLGIGAGQTDVNLFTMTA